MREHIHLRDEPATVQAPPGHEISVDGGPWRIGPQLVTYGDTIRVRRIEVRRIERTDTLNIGELTTVMIIAILTVPFALALLAWVLP